MPGDYAFTFASDVTFRGQEYHKGDVFESDDPCELLQVLDATREQYPKATFTEEVKGLINTALYMCPYSSFNSTSVIANPGETSEPKEKKFFVGTLDDGEQQGAPNVDTNGNVGGNKPKNNAGDPSSLPTQEPRRPAEGEKHDTHNGELPHTQVKAGDPVDIFSGIFYIQETDLEIPNTILPLRFTRYYRSGAPAFGPFGWNWDHNFNTFIRILSNGDVALWRNLHEETFIFKDDVYSPPCGVPEILERLSSPDDKFELRQAGGFTLRFERPPGWTDAERIPITRLYDSFNNYLAFEYGDENNLVKVSDDDGRYFSFAYDECSLLISVTDQAGRTFYYEHDEQTLQLISTISPPILDHPNGIRKYYHYEYPFAAPELRNNIIRIEDHQGRIYLENTYESDPSEWHFARLMEQYYGGYLFQYRYTQLQWTPEHKDFLNVPSLRVEVMNPDFGVETYTFNYRGDILDFRYRLVKDGSFRVVAYQYAYDIEGNLIEETRPDGSSFITNYIPEHPDPRMRHLPVKKEITSASGFPSPSRIIWTGIYNEEFQVLKQEANELGAVTKYKYDFDISPGSLQNKGLLQEIILQDVSQADGNLQSSTIKFEYNNLGRRTKVTYPDGTQDLVNYGASGNEKNRITQNIYDVNGEAIIHKIFYDVFGFPAEIIDGNGNATRQINNVFGLTEKRILPQIGGAPTELVTHYDGDKKEIILQKPVGTFTSPELNDSFIEDRIERDILGFPIHLIHSNNTSERRETRFVNDFRGNPIRILNPDDTVIDKEFDERGLILFEKVSGLDGLKMQSSKAYDRSGKLIQETDVLGNITKYKYDGFSRLIEKEFPNHTKLKNTWGLGDLLLHEEIIGSDGYGQVRTLSYKEFMYDLRGRKIKEITRVFNDQPSVYHELITTVTYDKLDRVIEQVNPYSGIEKYSYDGKGRPVKKTDSLGNIEIRAYDQNDNIIKIITQDQGSTSHEKKFSYDARNRLISVQEMDGSQARLEYDDRSLLIKELEYSGTQRVIDYNSHNEKTRESLDPQHLNIIHQWEHDPMGRILRYTDPTNQVVEYGYDSLGRRIRTLNPNGVIVQEKYNPAGLIESEDILGISSFNYKYDEYHRLSEIKNSTASTSILPVPIHTFQYDGLGRCINAQADGEIIQRKFDSISRLISETNLGQTITCDYVDQDRKVIKHWPDGRTESLAHTQNGILSSIKEVNHSGIGSHRDLIAKFSSDGAYHCTGMEISDQISIKNQFDEKQRLSAISVFARGQNIQQVSYHLDKNNRRRVEQIGGVQSKNSYFEYDEHFRLTKSVEGFNSGIETSLTQLQHDHNISVAENNSANGFHNDYTYNGSDDRITKKISQQATQNYEYDQGHRLISANGTNLEYSPNGDTSHKGIFQYQSDVLGRIVKISANNEVLFEIKFDALGRISKIREKNKPEKSYIYFGAFADQINENGIVSSHFTSAPGTGIPIAYHVAGNTFYPIIDGRYNLIALMDTNGNIVETYRYETFGAPHIFNSSGTEIPASQFGIEPVFGGQKYYSSIGLYVSKSRLMDPVLGVYLSPDPAGHYDSSSLYVYCAQNPVDNIDPDGEFLPLIAIGFLLGGLAGLGYSAYDHYHNPKQYRGWRGVWKYVRNTLGGGLIGATAVVAGEGVLVLSTQAIGPSLVLQGGTLTATQAFVIHGTSSAVGGLVVRSGFNSLFPDYVDPVSLGTVSADYFIGGGIGAILNKLIPGTYNLFKQGVGDFNDWYKYRLDKGGFTRLTYDPPRLQTPIQPELYSSMIMNNDMEGSLYARVSTQVHEMLHHFINKLFPKARYELQNIYHLGNNPLKLFAEEVWANVLGATASLRPHAILGATEYAELSVSQAVASALRKTGIGDQQAIDLGKKLAQEAAAMWKGNFIKKMGGVAIAAGSAIGAYVALDSSDKK